MSAKAGRALPVTSVVNLKFEPFDVYIGRKGKGYTGYFGNPVVIGEVCPVCGETHMSAGATLPCYSMYLKYRAMTDEEFEAKLESLRGKRLGCFCHPGPCHGDVILAYLEGEL